MTTRDLHNTETQGAEMSKLEELITKETRLRDEWTAAKHRLEEAEHATLIERFKDYEQHKHGDIILVPRKLFGKQTMWPAKVYTVRLKYSSGVYSGTSTVYVAGEPWENHIVEYLVYLKQADGTFKGSSQCFNHKDVEPYREPVTS